MIRSTKFETCACHGKKKGVNYFNFFYNYGVSKTPKSRNKSYAAMRRHKGGDGCEFKRPDRIFAGGDIFTR